MAEVEPETIKLDGREFVTVSQKITAAQDDYILVALNDCGAAEIIRGIAGGERSPEIGAHLLQTILRSGLTSQLLAGLLTEKGKKWTRLEADRNAELFAEITDNAEKVRMRQTVVGFVLGFFQLGEALSKTSPKSSNLNEKAPDISSEEVATSESSPELSAK